MSEASLVNTPSTLITPADRFSITLCFAIILHTVVILGVNFSPTERDQRHFQSMEIILVQQRSEQPEKPSYLAQANLTGGGDTEDPIRPATPLATPVLDLSPVIATSPSIKESPALPREPAEQQPEETLLPDERATQAAASPDPSQPPNRSQRDRQSRVSPCPCCQQNQKPHNLLDRLLQPPKPS